MLPACSPVFSCQGPEQCLTSPFPHRSLHLAFLLCLPSLGCFPASLASVTHSPQLTLTCSVTLAALPVTSCARIWKESRRATCLLAIRFSWAWTQPSAPGSPDTKSQGPAETLCRGVSWRPHLCFQYFPPPLCLYPSLEVLHTFQGPGVTMGPSSLTLAPHPAKAQGLTHWCVTHSEVMDLLLLTEVSMSFTSSSLLSGY